MELKRESRVMQIDLNCDMGESFGRWELGEDDAALAVVTSANIACGFHAGDPLVIQRTVQQAALHQVAIGAHPGYPDLQGFGRREMSLSPAEAEALILYQISALSGFCRAAGVDLVHVKPHGALYNQAAKDLRLAEAIARGVKRFSADLILVGLAGSKLLEAGLSNNLRVASEGFPDRAYDPDGSLLPRRLPGAVLESTGEICAQAVRLAREGIQITGEGGARAIQVDTLCIHGDHPGAALRAAAVRAALEAQGIQILPLI
jgi:5-oxoprolinase (ATP-hydrolysing) subunit A